MIENNVDTRYGIGEIKDDNKNSDFDYDSINSDLDNNYDIPLNEYIIDKHYTCSYTETPLNMYPLAKIIIDTQVVSFLPLGQICKKSNSPKNKRGIPLRAMLQGVVNDTSYITLYQDDLEEMFISGIHLET